MKDNIIEKYHRLFKKCESVYDSTKDNSNLMILHNDDVYMPIKDDNYNFMAYDCYDENDLVKINHGDKIIELTQCTVEDEVLYFFNKCFTNEGRLKCNHTFKTYLMYDGNFKAYKIGKSTNPNKREKILGAQFPRITLFAVCEENIETKLHRQYDSKRIRGEWFDLDNKDLKQIFKEYKFKII